MKQTWNSKQRLRRSFYVLTVADGHCAYRIQHPGSDDHYLSFVETLEPTLRRRRCMRFLPSFALAQLIQRLSQLPTRDRGSTNSAELNPQTNNQLLHLTGKQKESPASGLPGTPIVSPNRPAGFGQPVPVLVPEGADGNQAQLYAFEVVPPAHPAASEMVFEKDREQIEKQIHGFEIARVVTPAVTGSYSLG